MYLDRVDPLATARLLNGRDSPRRWANLGLWPADGAATYTEAARALALHLGTRVGLRPGGRVLDLGVGCGDQLDVWLDSFDVASIVALEPHGPARARAALRGRDESGPRAELLAARADRWPLEALGPFDSVLALDCAYHFESRAQVTARAFDALRPGGRLGLMDLVTTPGTPALLARLAPAFAIPRANWVTASTLVKTLEQQGFVDVVLEDRTEAVLGGFARHVAGRRRDLAREARFGDRRALVPVLATAALAGWAVRRRWLAFVCVTARRPEAFDRSPGSSSQGV